MDGIKNGGRRKNPKKKILIIMNKVDKYKNRFYSLLESELGNVKPLINEQENQSEDPTKKVSELSQELGSEIDPEIANEAMSCSFDEIGSGLNLKPEVKELIEKVKSKIQELVSKKDRSGLKTAFRQLKSRLQKAEPTGGETTEQAGLMATFVLLGVSAPLWVWVAAGAIILIILIKAIIALSSWIPKSKGRGCSRVVTYRVR